MFSLGYQTRMCVRGVGSLLTLELLRKFPMASSVARILLKV